jgi:hypothetical protein
LHKKLPPGKVTEVAVEAAVAMKGVLEFLAGMGPLGNFFFGLSTS